MGLEESVVLIPALGIDRLVGEFRERYDPGARAGVPAHITIMYPFLDPERLTDQMLGALDSVLAATKAFDYALTGVREFDRGVLYLAPEPAQPFTELTELVRKRFTILPYGGAHESVVPHLTVTQTAPTNARRRIARRLERALPRSLLASEAWLMVGHNETRWKTAHVTAFRR